MDQRLLDIAGIAPKSTETDKETISRLVSEAEYHVQQNNGHTYILPLLGQIRDMCDNE